MDKTTAHQLQMVHWALVLRQFLSDCGRWMPDELKDAIKAAIKAIEEGVGNG